ncbi:MAG: ribonuclease D [Pseudomonadales bacterium]
MSKPDFIYIDTDSGLADLCAQARALPALPMDTEFFREDTYYPKPALLQFNLDGQVYLVDPQAIADFSPLREIFAEPGIVKVMHSCSEDMEVFKTLLDSYPVNLFDTQIAAALSGYGFSLGYQRLVEMLLGEQLEKTETRSNWLQRPLTSRQCHYAADDVRWLPPLYQRLQRRLHELGRERWCAEDCERVLEMARRGVPDEDQYMRIRAVSRLSPASRNRLRLLCVWREREARQADVPKGRIASDATLLDIAERVPASLRELSGISKIRESSVRRYGEAMLACVVQAETRSEPDGATEIAGRSDRSRRELLRKLQAKTREIAAASDIPIEVLGKKRDLEEFIEARERSVIANGWRAALLADELATLCDEQP